jgi:prefoldin subunit 5
MAMNEESRLLSMRVLQNFVRETKGSWKGDQWQKLVQRVRRAGFEKIQESRIEQLVEENRERWLSGDNSVGPPPGGGKKEQEKGPGKRGEKMPEKKAEPPKPAAPTPAAPKPAAPKPASSSTGRSTAPVGNSKDVAIDSAEAQELHTRRLARLKRSQDLVNELTDMEADIRRLENAQTELRRTLDKFETQRGPLEKQRATLQDEVDKATKDISMLRSSIEKLTTQRAALEESIGHRRRERSEHVAAIAGFKAEKDGLIT